MRWQYRRAKEKARQEAIDWQSRLSDANPSYECLSRMQARFTELGRQYGLLKEFRENGII